MSKIRVVIQCRLASQRLPAKALLPVGGLPLFALCVRRAGNTGLSTILATSDRASDLPLVDLARRMEFAVFTGSELDVLGRFAAVARAWDEDDVVVRLTADNCFPDGEFIEELVTQMRSRSLEYFGTSSPRDGLPYGLSAEAFTVRMLRQADREGWQPDDREHVTPFIIARCRKDVFTPASLESDLSGNRCTVDTFGDYLRINRLFSDVVDPISVPWKALTDRLQNLSATQVPLRTRGGHRASALTFGSAQWGLRYGRANKTGIPDENELRELVSLGVAAGIGCIDSARAYGNAESRIGQLRATHTVDGCTVVTKLGPLDEVGENWSRDAIVAAVDASVYGSCRDLKQATLDTLLLHRWSHFASHSGAIWKRLVELKSAGVVRALGASVQSPQEAVEALGVDEITHIQLPFNILDPRWLASDLQSLIARRPNVVIHARSIFLQGIAIAEADQWPAVAGVRPQDTTAALTDLAAEFSGGSRKRLCLTYVLSHPWVASCVVGMETAQQCRQLVEMSQAKPFSEEQLRTMRARIGILPDNLLDPSKWEPAQ